MSKTKLWDVSGLTFKIIFCNPLILHIIRHYNQKGLSGLSKAMQLLKIWKDKNSGFLTSRSVVLLLYYPTLHSTALHCTILHHPTLFAILNSLLCTITFYTTVHCTELYNIAILNKYTRMNINLWSSRFNPQQESLNFPNLQLSPVPVLELILTLSLSQISHDSCNGLCNLMTFHVAKALLFPNFLDCVGW